MKPSDPQLERQVKPSAKAPLRFAPWVAMAALGAAWFRRRKNGRPHEAAARVRTAAEWALAEPGRGRAARAPWRIPPLGWKDIVWRSYRGIASDRLPAIAGGVTFYLLLATFPAVAAFVSLYGIFSDVDMVEKQLVQMSTVFPRDAVNLIGDQMVRLATQRHATLSVAFAVSTFISVWSANAGMKSLFDGINIAYEQPERRPYLHRTVVTYSVTLAALVFSAAATIVTVGAPMYLHARGLHDLKLWWVPFRWVIVYAMAAGAFTLLYRFGPSRVHARPRWRWVFCGGMAAALLWMGGSLGFSWYVNNFTHFGVTYGSLGAVIGFMLWVWFSVMVLLIGAEFNAEIEHQTACDTTTGAPLPLGQRGAVMADSVGPAFTVSPREARRLTGVFARRQLDAVAKVFRRKAKAPRGA
jgi:membrane protein